MSYLVLARKYRPKTFEEMVGQEHVLKALINALNGGSLHHAYLFTGTRGVGKTTVARIFAKCLNNEAGVTATPDLTSQTSQDIDKGNFVDLIEVDAASRTKVEQTRDLLENMHYPPSQGRFKVYLIDEVHMLSSHSFNALLKTLEEPPEHVKFLLATTDPQKLPITIVSRCLQFNLKQIPLAQIESQLTKVLSEESIEHDARAVQLLAKAGKGSLRDALSITDQAVAYTNRKIFSEEISSFLGVTDRNQIKPLMDAIIEGDTKAVIQAVDTLSQFITDFHHLIDDLLLLFQQAAIIQQVPDYHLPDQDDNHLANSLATKMTPENIQLYYQIALRGKQELDIVANERSAVEMILLRMLVFSPAKKQEQVTESLSKEQETEPESRPATKEQPTEQQHKKPIEADSNLSNEDWVELYSNVKLDGFALQILGHAELVEHKPGHIVFNIGEKHKNLLTTEYTKQIKTALSLLLEQDPLQVIFEVQEGAPESSPLMVKKRRKQQAKEKEQELIEQDPEVKALMDQFDATIVKTSATQNK